MKFAAERLVKELEKCGGAADSSRSFILSEAYPSPLSKAKGDFRYQIILRASATRLMTQPLNAVLKRIEIPKDVTLSIDVDAMNMG